MAYTNRNFTWDFDALKRFYEKYIVKWLNSAVTWTDAQKKQARANLGFGNGDFDVEPTAGSDNPVNSGGVYKILNKSYIYNDSNFTRGYLYKLSQGVGNIVSNDLSSNIGWAYLKTEVKAGQIINLQTIGGGSARAYALTNMNRVILSVAPADADYSTGITLNVEQDGYLYVNTSKDFLPYASVVISGNRIDILEGGMSELQDNISDLTFNFTRGYFYKLSQGVGNIVSNDLSSNPGWAYLKTEVKACQIINLQTIGGNSARAYALTNMNRVILSVAPAGADYSTGITLNVEQDGYLYVHTNKDFLPYASVVISGNRIDILEGGMSELQDNISELQDNISELQNDTGSSKIFNPHLDLTKDNLKILDIGNSFTNNAVHYLPDIIANYNIPNTYSLYKVIRSASSFKSWVECYKDNDDTSYYCSLVAGQSLTDVPTGNGTAMDGSLFRNVLSSVKWDMIIIHQVSTYSANCELWEGSTEGGYLKEYIRILKLTNPQAKIGFYLVHSVPSNSNINPEHSSLLRWQKISKSVKWMMANYGIDFVIPYGTAIQNIRQCSIIDSNELSNDGKHNANGLANYTASCCYFQQLFGARNGVNVMGDTFRITVDETVAGQISVTDDTAPLAQKAAILACCDAFSISNPEENILQ